MKEGGREVERGFVSTKQKRFLPLPSLPPSLPSFLPTSPGKASTLKDDEVLLILAQELGQAAFLPLVHSPAALLPTLTDLAGTEETVVREAAVASLLR